MTSSWLLALALTACGGDESPPPKPTCGGTTLSGDGLVELGGLSTYVHVPPTPEACAPLVVFVHGTAGAGTWDGSTWVEPNPTHLVEAADTLGFVLAVPGVKEGVDDHAWTLDEAGAQEIDAVLTGVEAESPVDPDAAFVVGISKGGSMASWYGLYHPEIARGIAPVSGGLPFDYPKVDPDPKLPFYIAHDPLDPEVPYEEAVALADMLEEHGHLVDFEEWELGQNGHGWNFDLPEPILAYLENPD